MYWAFGSRLMYPVSVSSTTSGSRRETDFVGSGAAGTSVAGPGARGGGALGFEADDDVVQAAAKRPGSRMARRFTKPPRRQGLRFQVSGSGWRLPGKGEPSRKPAGWLLYSRAGPIH